MKPFKYLPGFSIASLVLAFTFLLSPFPSSHAEDVKISASYPSPSGVYQQLQVLEADESPTMTNFTESLTDAGINIVTDFTADSYTPGIFWSTQVNNPTRPKAGIWMQEGATGSKLIFGTSNNYALGITNTGLVINQDGSIETLNGNNVNFENIYLPTTTATKGIIFSNNNRYVHSYGTDNFFAGRNAGNFTMTGAGKNTGVGVNALNTLTDGQENTAVGASALLNNTTGTRNTAVGYEALRDTGTTSLTGNDNTAMGYQALANNTIGIENTALGFYSLSNSTTGNGNTASGFQALRQNSTGSNNTAFGRQVLAGNTTTNDNTAIGYNALMNNRGTSNTAVGYQVLMTNTIGDFNTASGRAALGCNSAGDFNTAFGYNALQNTTTNNNTAIGYLSGYSGANYTNSTFVGYDTRDAPGFVLSYVIAIGSGARVTASNCLVFGGLTASTGLVNVGIGVAAPTYQLQLSKDSAYKPTNDKWDIVSDVRLKENITPFTDGLSVLQNINPVSYQLNGKAGTPRGEKGISVIAQEVKDTIPYTIHTYKAKLNPEDKEETELYDFNGSALTYVLINAVKELKTEDEALEARIEILERK